MCGIAGIWYWDGRRVSPDELSTMITVMHHRGPDDAGIYLDGSLGLGHRRLSIIDLSSAGHQPMATVPPVIKFKGGRLKHLFRETVKQMVPPEILARKDKMGFPVPLSPWYRTSLREFVRDILLSRRSRERGLFNTEALEQLLEHEQPFGRVVWGVLCLELWHQEFVDGR